MQFSIYDLFRHRFGQVIAVATIAVLAVAAYQWAYYTPAAVAVEVRIAEHSSQLASAPAPRSPAEQLGRGLQTTKALSSVALQSLDDYFEQEAGALERLLVRTGLRNETAPLRDLNTTLSQVLDLEDIALESFAEVEQHLLDIEAAPVIMDRHQTAVATFTEAMQPVKDIAADLKQSTTLQEQKAYLNELVDYLADHQFEHTHNQHDFENQPLPFGPRNGEAREPLENLSSLHTELLNPVTLASANLTEDILRGLTHPPDAPTPEDTAPTLEAPHTKAIVSLAESLNHDPVDLYNWVYSNIRSIPSWGSIQGAQYTLDLEAGNSFDTASLLLALLRASDIPARYAYGTIDVPVEKVMNWVGGAEVPAAAQQVMSQGGIPNIALTSGGEITHIRMEHIWVEAWVDFNPSRGLVHIEGDQWIPMDASFKQYELEAAQISADTIDFDFEAHALELMDNMSINQDAGYVQGLDASIIEDALGDFEQKFEQYIAAQGQDTTVGDVAGRQALPVRERSPLSAGLPYQVIDRTPQVQNMPDAWRHQFRVRVATDRWGSDTINVTRPTAELAGQDISLSFFPASQADLELIASYAPDFEESEDIDLSRIPRHLPGYLINLTPELKIGDESIQGTHNVAMGSELDATLAMHDPSFGWEQTSSTPVAGEYIAIGLDLQGISTAHLDRLEAQNHRIQQKAEAGDLEDLTRHDILGNLTQANIISYFAFNNMQDQAISRMAGQLYYRAPSYGMFHTQVNSVYWFGIPRTVNFPGYMMDVPSIRSIGVSTDNDPEKRRAFNQAVGARLSFMENWIPEQLLSTEEHQAEGISAVKALALANSQGQKIYQLDRSNMGELDNIIIDSGARTEIRNALHSGKTVTVHAKPLHMGSWSGSGYIIQDQLGGGAYKISGGSNGGFISDEWVDVLMYVGFIIGALGLLFGPAILVIISAVIAIALAYDGYLKLRKQISGTACADSGVLELYIALVLVAAVVGIIIPGAGAFLVLSWIGFLASGAIAGSFIQGGGVCEPN